MKNADGKLTITYDNLNQYYDLYVNGLNVIASGTLYLTSDQEMLDGQDPILVDGVDSGYSGMEYDFEVVNEYCLKVPQFQPSGSGELDFIFVDDGKLHKLSEMYDYGYHKINIVFNAIYPWDTNITSITFVNSISLSDYFYQHFEEGAIIASPNGQYMYIFRSLDKGLHQFEFTTPWDVTTLTYVRSIGDSVFRNARCFGIDFNDDGTKCWSVYGTGLPNNARVYYYDLSVPWDISSMTYTGEVLVDAPDIQFAGEMQMKFDGTKMWISALWAGGSTDLYQYSLSTAFDVTTATLDGILHIDDYDFSGFYVSEDGTALLGIKINENKLIEYSLPTKYNVLSGATMTKVYVTGVAYNNFNLRMYEQAGRMYKFSGPSSGWTVYEYEINKTT